MCVWNGRGGACVPARTSAQRCFHTKIYLRITHHARGFNDGCALAGRHGRAHRHHPYQTPSYFSVQSTHNQRPLRPRSCNTIHCLEMNERPGSPHYIPKCSRIETRITRPTDINKCRSKAQCSSIYLSATRNESIVGSRLTNLCKRTFYLICIGCTG